MAAGSNNFIQLSHKEVLPKLKLLSQQKNVVKVWAKGENSSIFRVTEVQSLKLDGEHVVLITLFSEGEEADQSILERKVFISFASGDLDYFSEGNVSLDETSGNLVLKLDKDVFRSEKRTNERLLTFPHHQVYAYFKIPKDDPSGINVIPLRREEEEAYLDYKKQQKEKLLNELAEKLGDVEDLIGFRALDISRSGIAFIVGDSEGSFFDQTKKYNFVILFDGDVYQIPQAKVVYKVDFVSRTNNGARFKVGLNFNPVDQLNQKIMDCLRQNDSLDSTQKEFEDFVEK